MPSLHLHHLGFVIPRFYQSLLLTLLLLPFVTVRAQDPNSGELRGKVVKVAIPIRTGPATLKPETGGQSPVPESQIPIPNAAVMLQSVSGGPELYSKPTDSEGTFYFPVLKYGKYKLSVRVKDFQEASVDVDVFTQGANEVVIEVYPAPKADDPIVVPRRPNEALSLPGARLRVLRQRQNLVDARRDGAYLADTVNSVSLGGASLTRSYDELAFYLPGIAAPPQTLSNFAGPGFGAGIGTSGQFSANGLRSRANNFTVDGSDNNDEDIGVRRQGFFSLVPQSVESIYEYQVITAAAPAQLGRNLGAQVNAVSQYGTNRVHGSFYGTLSTNLFNSADFFDSTSGNTIIPLTAQVGDGQRNVFVDGQQKFVANNAGRKDRFNFAQVGGTVGGPLWQSENNRGLKVYYFFSGEFQRLRATKETHFAVPTVEQRGLLGTGATGLNHNPFNDAPLNAFPTSAQGDAIFSYFPFPNDPGGLYGRNTFTQELPADGSGGVLSTRLDGTKWLFKRLHQFIVRQNFTQDYRDVPTIGGAIFSAVRPKIRAENFSFYVDSFLNESASSTSTFNNSSRASILITNQLFVSYGQTRFDFEDRNNTDFLIPTRTNIANPEDRRFLLNVPLLSNVTRSGASVVDYRTSNLTAEARLGTPFELIDAPIGQIVIAGFSPIGVDVFTFPQKRTNNTYQISDTLTFQTRYHTFAFGTDIRRSELNSRLPRNSRPLITFSGGVKVRPIGAGPPFEFVDRFSALDLAATGAPNGVFQTLTTGDDATIGLRYYQYNFFGRDQWRVRSNLSLSFGVRYEYNTPPREMHKRIEQTFTSPILKTVGLDRFIGGREQIFAPDRNNFAPRFGLAYSFGENYRNIIRIGGGIYYDQVPGVVVSQSRNVVPTFVTFNTAGLFESQEVSPGQFKDVGLGIILPSTFSIDCGNFVNVPVYSPGTLNTINPQVSVPCILNEYLFTFGKKYGFQPVLQTVLPAENLEMPVAYHYTASFEREIGADTVVSIAYVGTQGRHLLRQTTPNLGDNAAIVLPGLVITNDRPRFAGFVGQPVQVNATGQRVGRVSPLAGTVRIYEASANSRYDGLQLQVRGKLVKKTSYQFNYTLSKVTDDASDVFDLAGAPALPQNSLTRTGERSVANFDARHIFSGYVIYALPSAGPNTKLKEFFLNNWQATGKVRFQSGQPFTINSLIDVNGDGNLTDRPDTTAGISVTGNRLQPLRLTVDPRTLLAPDQQDGAVSRNTFRAGNLFELDLSLLKSFSINEKRRLNFRIDIFNLTNRANFGIPIRFLEAPGFGQVVNTVTPGRRIQFAFKYSF